MWDDFTMFEVAMGCGAKKFDLSRHVMPFENEFDKAIEDLKSMITDSDISIINIQKSIYSHVAFEKLCELILPSDFDWTYRACCDTYIDIKNENDVGTFALLDIMYCTLFNIVIQHRDIEDTLRNLKKEMDDMDAVTDLVGFHPLYICTLEDYIHIYGTIRRCKYTIF